jgi:hypothetical protein
MNQFFNNPTGSDVSFIFPEENNQIIYAHRIVLAANSPVFFKSFYGEYLDSTTHQFIIEDFSYRSFLDMMKHMYSTETVITYSVIAKFLEIDQEVISDCCMEKLYQQIEYTRDLYQVADCYQFDVLKTKCLDFVLDKCIDARCVSVLIADDDSFIHRCCLDFLAKNFRGNNKVKNLIINICDQETFVKIVSSEILQASEYQVFMLICDWCLKNQLPIDSFMSYVRYGELTEIEKKTIKQKTGLSCPNSEQDTRHREVFKQTRNKKKCFTPICAICQNHLLNNCIECEGLEKLSTGKCKFVGGYCGHEFHKHCILKWSKVKKLCPLCYKPWVVEVDNLFTNPVPTKGAQ